MSFMIYDIILPSILERSMEVYNKLFDREDKKPIDTLLIHFRSPRHTIYDNPQNPIKFSKLKRIIEFLLVWSGSIM